MPGGPNLWKITYKQDLFSAEQIIKAARRRVAIVTGGGRGIGAAVVRGLGDRGIRVAVLARTRAEVDAVAAEVNGLAICADVTKPQQVMILVALPHAAVGRRM